MKPARLAFLAHPLYIRTLAPWRRRRRATAALAGAVVLLAFVAAGCVLVGYPFDARTGAVVGVREAIAISEFTLLPLAQIVLVTAVVAVAAFDIHRARTSGELDLLRLTALRGRRIAGYYLARQLLRKPAFWILLLCLPLHMQFYTVFFWADAVAGLFFVPLLALLQTSHAGLQLATCAAYGLHDGLTHGSPSGAIAAALTKLAFIQFLIPMFCACIGGSSFLPLLASAAFSTMSSFLPALVLAFLVWPVLLGYQWLMLVDRRDALGRDLELPAES